MNFDSSNAPFCAITTAEAGSMGKNIFPECINRTKIMDLLGIDKIVCLNQEHTDIVFDSEEIDSDSIIGDGIITSGKRVLAVTVADCLPIFLYDPKNCVYGVVHSGWKGTGIVLNAVNKMTTCYGTKPENIHIMIGPSIGKCCYSVDKDRALYFASKWGDNTVVEKASIYFLDLKKANKLILENIGIKNITIDENCTCCNKKFHSYRRDGAEGFGQMLALIGYFG
ncbi:MAG: peptidoglycan editing factor PgeF [Spirochaetaceae bacterium]|nr:peptidoglycan editing factor PgeF [Spirochaetaceae bacterium]